MQFDTGIQFIESGLRTSLRGMFMESAYINLTNENVLGFDKVGYQRKEIINTSFCEYLGADGLATTLDDQVGRLVLTENPLDLSLATKGYFQVLSPDGVKLTRDGRFKLDKDGNLLNQEGFKVLSNAGEPIRLTIIPEDLKDISINSKGDVSVLNKRTKKLDKMGTLGVVDANGILVMNPDVKQGYNEHSNVSLEREFLGMMAPLRNFDANRQIFMIENSILSTTISQLGTTS